MVYNKINENGKDKVTYSDAFDYCNNLSYENYTDWRLPTANELVEMAKYPVAS
jgi:formylglycine-generating enzyme required for sulfatase activity